VLSEEDEEVHEIGEIFFGKPFEKSDFDTVIFEFIEFDIESD
jgi:hypothetical protein